MNFDDHIPGARHDETWIITNHHGDLIACFDTYEQGYAWMEANPPAPGTWQHLKCSED